MPNDFTVPAFLRAIGKGPDEKPEWWRDGFAFIDGPSNDCDFYLACPFADILTAWTPEKDALLLGVGLEYCRSVAGPSPALAKPEAKLVWQKLTDNGHSWYTLAFHCDRPGLTLARAIWDAVNGDGK